MECSWQQNKMSSGRIEFSSSIVTIYFNLVYFVGRQALYSDVWALQTMLASFRFDECSAFMKRWWNLLSAVKAHLWCGERLWELAAYQDSVRGTSGWCRKYSQVITSVHYCFTLEQSPDTKSAVSIFRSNSFWQDSVHRFSKKFCESPELSHVGFDCRGLSCIYENFIRSSYRSSLQCIWINARDPKTALIAQKQVQQT